MKWFHMDRLDLTFSGIDPAIAEAAARALPRILAERLARPDDASGPAGEGTVRISASPRPAALAERLAGHVAAQVRGRFRDSSRSD